MMCIEYKVHFFSDWHCSSGLSAGADMDTLVIKDENGLPYIPGKTIKGLLKEAIEDILFFRNLNDPGMIETIFGSNDKNQGKAFFTDVCLPDNLQQVICHTGLNRFMFRTQTSTSIDEKTGIAKAHSLRRIQTTVPCELYGEIRNVPETMMNIVLDGFNYIKRLGYDRNRGLGRCEITLKEGGKK